MFAVIEYADITQAITTEKGVFFITVTATLWS